MFVVCIASTRVKGVVLAFPLDVSDRSFENETIKKVICNSLPDPINFTPNVLITIRSPSSDTSSFTSDINN